MNALVDTRRGAGGRVVTFKLGGPMVTVAAALLLALVIQAFVGTEQDAFNWSAASAVVTLLMLGYCLRPSLFGRFPISTFAIVGFNAVTLAIPLVVQSATGRSFLYNLYDPGDTFVWIYLTSAVLVGTHWLYSTALVLNKPGQFVARNIFAPFGVFRMPSTAEIWGLGFVGFLTTLISWGLNPSAIEYGDVGGKALQSFFLFIAFPLLIPLRGLFAGRAVKTTPFTLALLGPYFGAVVLLGIAANQRTLFSFVAIGIPLAMLLLSQMGRLRLSGRTKLAIVALAVVAVPLFKTFGDLATAMTMVRGAKFSVSGADYLERTIEQMGDPEAIARYRRYEEQDSSASIGYNDEYIKAELVNRLVFTKYTDLTMNVSARLGPDGRGAMKQDLLTRLPLFLPTPIAAFFGFNFDKKNFEYSSGDLYESMANHIELGSMLTGSTVTYAKDAFGSAWIILMPLVFLLMFNGFDSLSLTVGRQQILAPVIYVMLYSLFAHGCINDNVAQLIADSTRNILQQAALYAVTLMLIRFLLGFVRTRA